MAKRQLLIFQWGMEKYGVPIEQVSGIIPSPWVKQLSTQVNPEENLAMQDMPLIISKIGASFQTESNKCAIIMQCNDIQIVLIADEVITEVALSDGSELEMDASIGFLEIWKLKHDVKGTH